MKLWGVDNVVLSITILGGQKKTREKLETNRTFIICGKFQPCSWAVYENDGKLMVAL